MRALLLVALVTAVALTVPVRAADSLAGVYLVAGENPGGKPYHGHCELIAQDAGYLLHWVLAPSEEAWGMGFVSHGRLIVAAGSPSVVGVLLTNVAVYSRKKADLIGEWTTPQSKGVYKEILVKTSEPMPAPPPITAPDHDRRAHVRLDVRDVSGNVMFEGDY